MGNVGFGGAGRKGFKYVLILVFLLFVMVSLGTTFRESSFCMGTSEAISDTSRLTGFCMIWCFLG